MMTLEDQFRTEIEAYLQATGMTPTRFGVEILGDPGFLYRMREKGRSPTIKTIDKVRAWMAENPPEAAA